MDRAPHLAAVQQSHAHRWLDAPPIPHAPTLADAPSKLAVVGRYVFSNHIFDYLANTRASVGGEIQLTDAIDALISKYGVNVTTMRGDSYDAGDMRSYMQAFIYFAEQQLRDDK